MWFCLHSQDTVCPIGLVPYAMHEQFGYDKPAHSHEMCIIIIILYLVIWTNSKLDRHSHTYYTQQMYVVTVRIEPRVNNFITYS